MINFLLRRLIYLFRQCLEPVGVNIVVVFWEMDMLK